MRYVISTNLKTCTRRYYSIKNRNKSCVLVFKNKNDVINFSKFLIQKKCLNNTWPFLDMDKQSNILKYKQQNKCHIPMYVSKFITVVEWEDVELDKFLGINGVDAVVGEHFIFNELNDSVKMNTGFRKLQYNDTFQLIQNLERL